MIRCALWVGILLAACACGGEGTASQSTQPAPTAVPVTPAAPKPTAPAASPSTTHPAAANPCATPGPLTIEIEAGVIQTTPWGLELTYAIDEDAKRGPGYLFLLHLGDARWETRRDNGNWTKRLTWHGFCWRGADRPERRASRVKIQIAPVCKDGVLQELGGCGTSLSGS